GLRGLPDTLASRAIIVHMRRRAPDEHVEPWRERRVRPQAEAIYRRLAGWWECLDLTQVEPEMPAGIIDPGAGGWEALVAIADAAGGSWPQRARQAAVSLTTGARDDLVSPGVELLAHIQDAFGAEQALPTERLLQRLHERPESPWRDMRGKPLDDRGLARSSRSASNQWSFGTLAEPRVGIGPNNSMRLGCAIYRKRNKRNKCNS